MHIDYNDCPLAHGKIEVRKEMLSYYQLQIIQDNNFSLGTKKRKFITNLGNKRKCKLPYQNLKLYLSLELQNSWNIRIQTRFLMGRKGRR